MPTPRIPADAYRPTFVKSLVMVPIRTESTHRRDRQLLGRAAATRPATDAEVRFLQALADATSVAIENLRMIAELEAARRDSLMRLAIAAEYRDDGTHAAPPARGPHRDGCSPRRWAWTRARRR